MTGVFTFCAVVLSGFVWVNCQMRFNLQSLCCYPGTSPEKFPVGTGSAPLLMVCGMCGISDVLTLSGSLGLCVG